MTGGPGGIGGASNTRGVLLATGRAALCRGGAVLCAAHVARPAKHHDPGHRRHGGDAIQPQASPSRQNAAGVPVCHEPHEHADSREANRCGVMKATRATCPGETRHTPVERWLRR